MTAEDQDPTYEAMFYPDHKDGEDDGGGWEAFPECDTDHDVAYECFDAWGYDRVRDSGVIAVRESGRPETERRWRWVVEPDLIEVKK